MSDYPSILLENAVNQMASLPGVGRKTALRLTLSLLRRSPEEVEQFASSFSRLRTEVRYCRICHNITDSEVCPICSSHHRDHSLICVVENVQDVMSIERTGQYNGTYHVLGGIINPMDGIGPSDLNISSLIDRLFPSGTSSSNASGISSSGLAASSITEVILALPTTMEGDTTNFYIYRRIMNALQSSVQQFSDSTSVQQFNNSTIQPQIRISQLARGVAIGNDLEYTDEITLGRSILNRVDFRA